MKSLILVLGILLAGCTTVAVKAPEWPTAPGQASLEPCLELKQLEAGAKLSDVAKTINYNYQQYWICSAKVVSWQEWYRAQQQIYNKAR